MGESLFGCLSVWGDTGVGLDVWCLFRDVLCGRVIRLESFLRSGRVGGLLAGADRKMVIFILLFP